MVNTWRCLLLGFWVLASCGSAETEVAGPADVGGTWAAVLPRGNGVLELHMEGSTLRGVLDIDDYVWAVTGETLSPQEFYFVLLPSRNEQALFAALGFTGATAPSLPLAHAADRIVFQAAAAGDYRTAEGTARSHFGASAPFWLKRK